MGPIVRPRASTRNALVCYLRRVPDAWLKTTVLEKGLVAIDDVVRVEAWTAVRGARLAEKLYRSGLLSDRALVELFVAKGAQDATQDLVDKLPPPAALGALSRAIAEKHRALGLRIEKGRLLVAMLDPSDTDAIEALSFFAGLAVEPRVVRAAVLFARLHEAYGTPEIVPDPSFLGAATATAADDDSDTLPPPSPFLPRVAVQTAPLPPGDLKRSPLAKGIAELTGGAVDDDSTRSLLAVRPARSPKAPPQEPPKGTSPREMRDSLPPQVLPLLVPPFRVAALFLVRDKIAVGWAARAKDGLPDDAIRDVLLPLTGPSAFQRAWGMCGTAMGTGEHTTVEKMFFRFTKLPAPTSFAVVPILVGEAPAALLYLDTHLEGIADDELDVARRVGDTLADGLAPLVSAGTVFTTTKR